MTSRRPMTRSFSGNGRTSSFSEEEGSSSSNGRNTYLSNVRPENRSTLCTVMAQLTEDVQPSFETTLKSKAVSENCNVKFTCVVTGYPAPELKWYKDDMEMDRYCGLPKYEIARNGKTHTLHIYNCTLDDAAIYQVSACNSKGIVSCSGVLEVGTMSEYQIHQRFFAKLKAKAEKKKQDLEGQNRRDRGDSGQVKKETTAQKSPERTPRKRPIPEPKQSVEEPLAGAAGMGSQNTAQEPVPPSPVATAPADSEVKKDNEHDLAKKKIKISNCLDAQTEQPGTPNSGSGRNQAMGNGGDNHYDGGMGLAQFLAETLQSQAAEDKQVSNNEETTAGAESAQEKAREEDSTHQKEEEMEQDSLQVRADHEVKEDNKEKSHPTPPSRQKTKLHSKSPKEHTEHKEHKEHKDHKDHHIQGSLSSMLHSVKDFFFGKNKKDMYERPDHREKDASEQTPPSFHVQSKSRSESKVKEGDEMPMEVAQSQEATTESSQKQDDMQRAESVVESPGHGTEGGRADQAMELTAREETPLSSAQLLTEVMRKDDQLLKSSDSRSDDTMDVPKHPSKAHSPPFQRRHTQGSSEGSTDTSLRLEKTSVHNPTFECQPQQHTQHSNDLASQLQDDETVSSESSHVQCVVPDRKANNEENTEQQAVVLSAVQEMNVEPPSVVSDSAHSAQSQSVTSQGLTAWSLSVSANEVTKTENNVDQQETIEIQIPIETIPLIQISTIEDTQDMQAASQNDISFTERIQENLESLQTENRQKGFVHDINALPEIKICSTEDIPEIHAVVPVICIEDVMLPPTAEVSQLDVKEGPSLITPLSQEMESDISQKEFSNWSNVIIQNDFVSDFCTQKEQEAMSTAHEPPQIHYPIPIINVSSTEEAIGLASDMSPSLDTATLPLFVTPLATDMPEHREIPEHREALEQREITERRETCQTENRGMIEHKETSEHFEITDLEPTTEIRETNIERRETPENREKSEVKETAVCRDLPTHRETTEQRETIESRDITTIDHKDMAETEQRETDEATGVESQSADKQPQGEQVETNVIDNKLTVMCDAPQPDASVLALSKTVEDSIENEITQSLKEARIESFMSVERLSFKPPLYPSLSPASLRKFMSKTSTDPDTAADRQSDKADDSLSGGSTPTSSLSCESSPRLKRRDSLSLIRSATPEELASGARRKIFIPKTKEDNEDSSSKKDTPYMSPGQTRRGAFLQPPSGQSTPPVERRSPLLNRRKATLEVPKVVEEIPVPEEFSNKQEEKSGDKKPDPLKAPQVIRKIRGEPFPDASGHLKLWCQFFNVLSDSTIKWYKDEQEILEVQRSGGDESQVALAIVLASTLDCAVYGCTINNEYGSDTTDFLLSEDVMGEILLKDDLEVGEEIEMIPLTFNRGLADSGSWGGKFFGRIMTEAVHLGEGSAHKASRAKVIYGLEPVFESGSSCIMKIQNPIPYGTKLESNLAERNQEITKQECKVQNMIREYCKIFAAEARVIDNFGSALEVVSQYLMYRPANSVPYATVELDLLDSFETYCWVDAGGKLNSKGVSEVEQKCCTLQHWLHEWTHSNLLLTRLEGVDFKLTNIKVVTKSKGYQGLSERASPELFDQFLIHHQCNYYCGLLSLRPLKSVDSLQTPSKIKGSRSPMLNRKLSVGSGSPHAQKKASLSPHSQRKAGSSPKAPRKSQDRDESNSAEKNRAVDSR